MSEFDDAHYIAIIEQYVAKLKKNPYSSRRWEFENTIRECQKILHERIMSRMEA